jgi:parvulin-like peptidyl-prolyl isomerase
MKKVLTITGFLVCSFLAMQSGARAQQPCKAKLTKDDMEFLLKDAPPQALKNLQDPEVRKKQIKNLKDMFALACAAEKEGMTKDLKTIAELEDIRIQIFAVNYDREVSKDKPVMPPFGYIGDERVEAFWNAAREAEFQKFFEAKISMAKAAGSITGDREPSEKEVKEAREYFAKTRIYDDEAKAKWNELPVDLKHKIELAVLLQQRQFLAREYAEKVLTPQLKVSDEEVEKYLAAHPEFDTKDERAKAEKLLQRAKSGEDFARLATEFSEDPGSKEKGGLYENVWEGVMVPEFEQAALALEPGQIAPNLVETKYGFHIIKLVKKGEVADKNGAKKQTYDVRHILIMTTVKDPSNPLTQSMSPQEFAKSRIEEEKENAVLDKIAAENPVDIAEDFSVPIVSDEELQKMMKEQMQKQMPQTEPKNEPLPNQIKSYLERIYKGWKLSPSDENCRTERNNGVVKGNFNADKRADYAVKFTRGKKGYVITFLALAKGYKAFVFRNYTAAEADNSSLVIWENGASFPLDKESLSLKYDAPGDFHCESGKSGIHYYRNGKFITY